MGIAKRKDKHNEHWLEVSLDKLHADRALFALADMQMRDWCSSLGGIPSKAADVLGLRCALEPAATKLLANLMAMSDDDRRALAHRLWPIRSRETAVSGGERP